MLRKATLYCAKLTPEATPPAIADLATTFLAPPRGLTNLLPPSPA